MSANNTCDSECNLELVPDDVVPLSAENTRVVFASLYTYADEKDESEFQKIHLPPICLEANDLYNMFYQSKLKRFNPYVLNKLIGALSKLPLIDAVLSNYEAVSGNDRMSLTAQQKILLRQELSTVDINSRIKKIVHLDSADFIDSFADDLMWFDEVAEVPEVLASEEPLVEYVAYVPEHHSMRTSVEIHIFSESLQSGIILIVQFIVFINADYVFDGIPSSVPITYDINNGATIQGLKCGMCVTYNASPSV